LTTLGQNITALEVDGSFDDCQAIVKEAFMDGELNASYNLTSANSINVARWLPQQLYYFFAWQQWVTKYQDADGNYPPMHIVVPSGNFGNICAGMIAKESGLPLGHFVAACNANDVVTRYMATEKFEVKPSVVTISNAMDVGNPSNFIRIQAMYKNDLSEFKKDFSSFSFSDTETEIALQTIYKSSGYIAEPHGVVGYLGLKKELENHPSDIGIFLETAHPIKFLDVVESLLNVKLPIPSQIQSVLNKEKLSVKIKTYEDFKAFLKL
jgi:threonine synthase